MRSANGGRSVASHHRQRPGGKPNNANPSMRIASSGSGILSSSSIKQAGATAVIKRENAVTAATLWGARANDGVSVARLLETMGRYSSQRRRSMPTQHQEMRHVSRKSWRATEMGRKRHLGRTRNVGASPDYGGEKPAPRGRKINEDVRRCQSK